jgi:hypothetical protein
MADETSDEPCVKKEPEIQQSIPNASEEITNNINGKSVNESSLTLLAMYLSFFSVKIAEFTKRERRARILSSIIGHKIADV